LQLCLAGLLAVWLVPRASWAYVDEFHNGNIESFSRTEFLINTFTPITVVAKNLGGTDWLTIAAVSVPYGWEVRAAGGGTQATRFLKGQEKGNFPFEVKSSSLAPTGTIKWRLTGTWYDGSPNFLQDKDQEVVAVFPPGTFNLIEPYASQENIDIPMTFRWESASGANSYSVELFDDQSGWPSEQPFYQSPEISLTSLLYSGPQLLWGQRYWWQVVARNAYSSTINAGGKASFVTLFPTPPGVFEITSPIPNYKYPDQPGLYWSAAADALYYVVELFQDVNGSPAATAFLRSPQLSALSWDYGGASLTKGKTYWITVTAWSKTFYPRKAANCPLKFTVSQLNPFEQLNPTDYAVYQEMQPRFTWKSSFGAHGYRVEIRGNEPANEGFRYMGTTSETVFQYTGPSLTADKWYRWQVYALAPGEELIAGNAPARFRIQPVKPFLLQWPEYDQRHVSDRPSFEWQSAPDALSYRVEIARDNPANPDEKHVIYSKELFTAQTQHSYEAAYALEKNTRYYWRVFARSGVGEVGRYNEGGWRPFQTDDFEVFRQVSPIQHSFYISLEPVFTWEAPPNVDKYTLVLWRANTFGEPLGNPIAIVDDITTPRLKYIGPRRLTGTTPYVWRVYAWRGELWWPSLVGSMFTTETSDYVDAQIIREAILGYGAPSQEAAPRADANADGVVDCVDLARWLGSQFSP
jgi:hypothetical protein